jgi:hypothetical protein
MCIYIFSLQKPHLRTNGAGQRCDLLPASSAAQWVQASPCIHPSPPSCPPLLLLPAHRALYPAIPQPPAPNAPVLFLSPFLPPLSCVAPLATGMFVPPPPVIPPANYSGSSSSLQAFNTQLHFANPASVAADWNESPACIIRVAVKPHSSPVSQLPVRAGGWGQQSIWTAV